MFSFDINTEGVVKYTEKMERLHRSALPVAIRSTLNNAAFDVKKNTIPKEAEKAFTIRKANFFKAKSRVNFARGFNIEDMSAVVGFIGDSQAVKNLKQQDQGGKIGGRSFVPTDVARGGNRSKTVRPSNRLSKIKNVVNAKKMKGTSPGQRFIQAAIEAGRGGYILSEGRNRLLLKVTSIRETKTKGTRVKTKKLYSYKENRSVKVQNTGFMQKASTKSAQNLSRYYTENAKKQINRIR